MSNTLSEVSKMFKIKQINCTAYYPQSNGALERSHQTLADYLRHYINLKTFEEKLELITLSQKQTENLCSKHEFLETIACKTSLVLLNQIIPNLYRKDQTLKQLTNRQHRVKRAWFNIIGSAFKTVFGTLNEDDAKIYNDAINHVSHDEHNLAHLLKKQIQVVKTTLTNFNHTINNLNDNRDLLNANLQKIAHFTANIQNHSYSIEFQQTIEENFELLMLLTAELEHELSTLINTILFAKTNTLHPIVMTPQQLIMELSKTIPYIKSSNIYPFSLSNENANKFMDIVEVKYHYSEKRIVYVISIPLVDNMKYSLYNLVPLPILHPVNKHFLFILPSIKYLAVSEIRNTYTTFNNINKCKYLDDMEIMCIPEEPIYIMQSRRICETELLTANQKVDVPCDTRVLPSFI